MSLLLNETGGSTLSAQVAFTAYGTAAYNAELVEKGAVADTGVGIAAFAAGMVRSAASAFVGHGTFATAAARVLSAIAAFTGSATFASLATRIRTAAVAHTGAATFLSAGELAEAALVSFTGTATFAPSAGVVHAAAIDFGGAADVEVGTPPIPLQPNETGGYGFEKKDIVRRPRQRHRTHVAAIAFRAHAEFEARARLDPAVAEMPVIPFLELPDSAPVPPFIPAIAGHIEPSVPDWTDEEMLVALLTFAEAA